MAIPHMFMAFFYGIAVAVVVFIAWFAVVITGRYPQGMYEFVAGFLRYSTRVNAYYYLVTDEYPGSTAASIPSTRCRCASRRRRRATAG